MIIREWRGRSTRERSAEYPKHFLDTVVPQLRCVPGFVGAYLCERQEAGHVEFLVMTQWASMDAVRAFAGADPESAVVEPGAIAALMDYDQVVRHYQVLEDVSIW